ncbi:replicative DNA helicase [Caloramator quimbayensis]|uniref:Replicative DNA helicase n=1 Tax=Caloramator quimbayensis TaxID=1147123 RepID=A0A1T4Y7M1_9CLOT|nr:replicative DNA helicase [Caloramator quimbayensis]SKA97528.1 replicative DNA helicase [Caloramator quimbayensis]
MEGVRVPPHNIEAEQAVIGAMLLDKEAIAAAAEILSGEEFYKESHKLLFQTIVEIFNKDEPVDIVTLVDVLKSREHLEVVGGVSYISSLAASVPTTSNVKYYAKIVEEKSILRRLIFASSGIIEKCYTDQEKVEEVLGAAEKSIFDISQKKGHQDFEHLSTIISRSFDEFERLYKNKGQITGIPSGFTDLDRKTSGFQKSDFILIAARPSMGKTAFALNIALHAALRAGKSVAIFSLEMSKEQLVYRMLCSEANVDMLKLRTGDLDEEDWMRLGRAAGPMSNANIFIDDTPGISVVEMRSKCRRLKIEKGLDLILIDYLQLMTGSGRTDNRQQEVSEISRSLKGLAKEMEAPVISLSQLSRAPEARADHRPILSDLRESGSIEQDADIVMFLYRDEYYNKETDKKGIAEAIIAKQRNGPTGTTELAWLGQYTKFGNLDRYHND